MIVKHEKRCENGIEEVVWLSYVSKRRLETTRKVCQAMDYTPSKMLSAIQKSRLKMAC